MHPQCGHMSSERGLEIDELVLRTRRGTFSSKCSRYALAYICAGVCSALLMFVGCLADM